MFSKESSFVSLPEISKQNKLLLIKFFDRKII